MARGKNVIEELRETQERLGWVTEEGLEEISRRTDKPVHEFFGKQADLLLESASTIIETTGPRASSSAGA